MALVLPAISTGSLGISAPAMYPMQRSVTFDTKICVFMDGSQQRWMNRGMLENWQLNYSQVSDLDRQNLDAFFQSTLGSAQTWTFARGGPENISLANCQFVDDSMQWTKQSVSNIGSWNGTLKFRQVANTSGIGPSMYPGPFPTLGTVNGFGYQTGYPFIRTQNFFSIRAELDTGGTIVRPLIGSGLTGYPSRQLYRWTLSFTVLSDADLFTLQSHFFNAAGRYTNFAFTDLQMNKTFTKVAYAMDTFDATYQMKGISSVTIQLQEVYGPGWTA